MTQGLPLDYAEVHRKIWDAKNRNGTVKIHQKKLAKALKISAPHMSRVIKSFKDEGRLKKIGTGYRNTAVYIVRDPAEFPDPEAEIKSGVAPGD